MQILTIVKAQFPGFEFSNVGDASDCGSGDHPLVCQWRKASSLIREYQTGGGAVAPALAALHKVKLYP
jgi:hypothetical protein